MDKPVVNNNLIKHKIMGAVMKKSLTLFVKMNKMKTMF